MNGFKKWLEDVDREKPRVATNQDQTVDYVPNDPKWSVHTNTPNGAGSNTQVINRARHATEPKDFMSQLVRALYPVDPHLYDRRGDGKQVAKFSGTPGYAPPEETKKIFKPQFEYEEDQLETFLKRSGEQFVWLERPCNALLKRWLTFRTMLHQSNEAVNPVIYQVGLLRLKTCEQQFPKADAIVQGCEDSDKHADVIKAWNGFYEGWNELAPTLKHYLVTFEKNTKKF